MENSKMKQLIADPKPLKPHAIADIDMKDSKTLSPRGGFDDSF